MTILFHNEDDYYFFRMKTTNFFQNEDDYYFFRMKMIIIFVVLMFCYVNQAVGKTYLIQTVVSKKGKIQENLILQEKGARGEGNKT